MLLNLMKACYVALNVLLLFVAGLRILLPFYLYYGTAVLAYLNYDRYIEFTSFWMIILVPWDIILAVSAIQSIIRNDREQIFENTFKLSVYGLVVIWLMEGIGDRFQLRAPYVLKLRMKKYYVNPRDRHVVDYVQRMFKCCGYSNVFTWSTETGIPSSCCQENVCTSATAYPKGCKYVFSEYVDKLNMWLVLANFPFIELVVSLWNCFLTDILPSSNLIYELGDDGDDHVVRERNDREPSAPPLLSPIPQAASVAMIKEYNNVTDGIRPEDHVRKHSLEEREQPSRTQIA